MKPRHALRREDRRAARAAAGQRQIRTPAQILSEDYRMSPRQIDEVTHQQTVPRRDQQKGNR